MLRKFISEATNVLDLDIHNICSNTSLKKYTYRPLHIWCKKFKSL